MRSVFVAVTLVLAACGDVQTGSQAFAPAASSSSLPSVTPLPSGGVVDPQPLVQRVKGMTGIVLRIDDIATKLVSSADYAPGSAASADASVPNIVWVVAVVGEIRPSRGVIARPNSPCGLFAFRADTGEIWSSGGGSLSACQPYFARSLAPPDAPIRCASDDYDNGISRDRQVFSRTRPGPFALTPVRDDSWRQPTIVRGAFLAQAPEGSTPYVQAFCVKAFIQTPAVETLVASGVGATVQRALPPLDWAIWLRGFHAVSGSADAEGHIDVVVEPRAGYEWAFFDWHALVPDGGYVMFRFIDAAGREILPWRLANGP